MNPGSLVTPSYGSVHMYESIEPNLGIFISTMFIGDLGIVIDFGFSHWDIPYLQVLLPDGKIGWVRKEKVEVLQ